MLPTRPPRVCARLLAEAMDAARGSDGCASNDASDATPFLEISRYSLYYRVSVFLGDDRLVDYLTAGAVRPATPVFLAVPEVLM